MKTRAAVLHERATGFSIEDVDLAEPRRGEVRVRVAAAGVCHSDWNLVTGDTPHPKPVVAGHEGAGVVEALGPGVADLNVGDHVALSWAPSCGSCFYCKLSRPALCTTHHDMLWAGCLLDGTPRLSQHGRRVHHYCGLACFADHAVVPRASCVKLPRGVPLEQAALIGCAVTTGVGAAINTAKIEPGSTVVVAGCGGVGLSVIMGAAIAGAERIIAIDRLPSRREAALAFGATDALDGESLYSRLRGWTAGRGPDFIFDTTGNVAVQQQCLEALSPGGTLVLIGLPASSQQLPLFPARLVREEKTIKGSYYGTANPPVDFVRYAGWAMEGKLPLGRLISRSYGLEEINDAYADMLSGKTLRGVITFNGAG